VQIIFTLRAVNQPANIPISLASLNLVKNAAEQCRHAIMELYMQGGGVGENLSSLHKLYNIEHIANKVEDGKIPYPENQQTIQDGISVQFRYVA
jgi:hypothetical protein